MSRTDFDWDYLLVNFTLPSLFLTANKFATNAVHFTVLVLVFPVYRWANIIAHAIASYRLKFGGHFDGIDFFLDAYVIVVDPDVPVAVAEDNVPVIEEPVIEESDEEDNANEPDANELAIDNSDQGYSSGGDRACD